METTRVPPSSSSKPAPQDTTASQAVMFSKPVETQATTIAKLRGKTDSSGLLATTKSIFSYLASFIAYPSDFDRLQNYYSYLLSYAQANNGSKFNSYFTDITPTLQRIGTQTPDSNSQEVCYLAFKEACKKVDSQSLKKILELTYSKTSKCNRNGIAHLMQLTRDELLSRNESFDVLAVNRKIAAFQSPLHDGSLQSPMKALGSGAINTVYKADYENNGMFAYKEDTIPDYIPTSGVLGIEKKNPLLGSRSVATYQYSQLLHFDVIIPTYHIEHNEKMGIAMSLAKGLAQKDEKNVTLERFPIEEQHQNSRALIEENIRQITWDIQGNPILKTQRDKNRFDELMAMTQAPLGIKIIDSQLYIIKPSYIQFDPHDPILRMELTKLALLDILTQQYDRHCGNYFFEYDPVSKKVIGVKGIDNDFSFGKKLLDPRKTDTHRLSAGFNGVALPRVVDEEMYQSIISLKPESLTQILSEELPEDNITIALQLLDIVQTHLRNLKQQGHVIKPDEWGSAQADEWLNEEQDQGDDHVPTSYVSRDVQFLMQEAERGHLILNPSRKAITVQQ